MRCLFVTETAKREQSRHRLFNYLYEIFNDNNIDFRILAFMESSNEPILSDSGLDVPVESIAMGFMKRNSVFKFWSYLSSLHPDHILIGGYGYIENWLALFYSIIYRIPVTLWTGAGSDSTINNSKIHNFFKMIFINYIKTAVTYGSNATKYLIKIGMDHSKINSAINVSNVGFFKKILADYFESDEMKAKLKDLPKPILVFAGRIEASKGVDLLIEQLKLIPNNNYFCYFIGKGNLTSSIQTCIDNKEINGKLLGFLGQEDVAKCLVESDVYILPSLNDPFSRTLSEALASGCFVLNSKYDDASYDLIKKAKNGFIFDPKNFKEFKYYLDMVTDKNWKRPSRNVISDSLQYDMTDYAKTIVKSVLESIV